MELHTHRFRLGSLDGLIVADDLSPISEEDARGILPSLPEAALELFRAHPETHVFSRNVLYLEGNEQRILIDTGIGHLNPDDPGWTLAALESAGVDPAGVQTIIMTHLHGDHFGGLLDAEKRPVYPNAALHIHQREWDYWMTDPSVPPDRAARVRPAMEPFKDTVRFFQPDERITPDVCAVSLPGHTPGHMGLMIESGGERLFHIADALHMAIQLSYPECSPGFDSQPDISPVTRRAAIRRAVDEHLWTLVYHLPFPGLGYIRREGESVMWEAAPGSERA